MAAKGGRERPKTMDVVREIFKLNVDTLGGQQLRIFKWGCVVIFLCVWQCLVANPELLLENDEEDDFKIYWVMGLGLRARPHSIPSHVRGSRPGKSPNIGTKCMHA